MLETTGDLKLKKIELTDTPDITVINPNWDKLDEEVTRSKTNIGNITQLTTQNKASLVHAINEIDTKKIAKTQIKNNLTETVEGNVLDATMGKVLKEDIDDRALKTEVGTLSGLATTVKTSLVHAVNEISGYIGKLQSLATNAKTSLVDAINENTNKINDLSKKVDTSLPMAVNGETIATRITNEIANGQIAGRYRYTREYSSDAPTSKHGIISYSKTHNSKYTDVTFVSDDGNTYISVLDSSNATYFSNWTHIATTTKTDILFPYATGFTDKGEDEISKISKVNNLVTISLCVKKSDDGVIPQWGIIGFLPEGYRPNTTITSGGMANNNTVSCMYINKYGAVQIGSVATINNFMGSISFFVN